MFGEFKGVDFINSESLKFDVFGVSNRLTLFEVVVESRIKYEVVGDKSCLKSGDGGYIRLER